jgi:hypothetical protein
VALADRDRGTSNRCRHSVPVEEGSSHPFQGRSSAIDRRSRVLIPPCLDGGNRISKLIEPTNVMAATIDWNGRPPLVVLAIPGNATMPWCVVGVPPWIAIVPIQNRCRSPKVRLLVVERVAIFVVHFWISGLEPQQEPVQQDEDLPPGAGDCVLHISLAGEMPPTSDHDAFVILVINESMSDYLAVPIAKGYLLHVGTSHSTSAFAAIRASTAPATMSQ